jgi:hypothetical protein
MLDGKNNNRSILIKDFKNKKIKDKKIKKIPV